MNQDPPFRPVKESEAFDGDTPETFKFAFCQMLFVKDDEYYTCHKADREPASVSRLLQLFAQATSVPHTYDRTPLPTTFACTQAREPDSNMYLKIAVPFSYKEELDRGTTHVANQQLQELRVCEVLLQNPHRNICTYFGYLPSASGDHIRGLCFERHQRTLYDAVMDGAQFPPAFLDGIHEAIKHLHSLGYVHNDLNPSNIMISKAGDPILIDFDSSLPLGLELTKGGVVSAKENDLWALAELREWIAGRRQ